MDTYRVVTYREEGYWIVEIPELDLLTQAKRLDQVERMARSIISLHLETSRDAFAVTVEPKLPAEVAAEISEARQLRAEATAKAEQAARLWADSARVLYLQGLPYRDVGAILGVSFQRAKQLVDEVQDIEDGRAAMAS
ncbi:MAG: type II toxin-antitoxin system HicB family antitoxin [Streptosporangiales bacterium]